MEKHTVRLDVIALVLSIASLGSSIAISLWTHADSSYREARKPFFEQQLKQYVEAADIVSKIASLPFEDSEWKAAYYRFQQIHWGGMYLIESKQVESKMLELDALFTRLEVPTRELESAEREDIRHRAAILTCLMHQDIKKSWDLKAEDDPRGSATRECGPGVKSTPLPAVTQ